MMFQWLVNLYSDKRVAKKYLEAGGIFGDAVSYIYMGECVGFDTFFRRWRYWENEYARRGYRTIPLEAFIGYGGYGRSIQHMLLQKRHPNESPVFHALTYVAPQYEVKVFNVRR